MQTAVTVFGAAGYSGLELLKLLAHHPRARVVAAASDTHAGRAIIELTGAPQHATMTFARTEDVLARAGESEVAFLAVPPEPARALARSLRARGVRVVDLSDAHRKEETYGMTALFSKDVASTTTLVANPGCYATAIVCALAPLVRAGAIDPESIAVSAASGVTGAGRKSDESYSLGELSGDMRAYKVLRHQHVPEIEAALTRVAGTRVRVCLTTHLLPIARGILATVTARARAARTSEALTEILRAEYVQDPFISIARTPEDVSLRRVVGTNQCMIGVASDGSDGGFVVMTSAIDNLLKGAAGQALENMNLLCGHERTLGLSHLSRHT
jgi:N-acetyl-gamma-glutamyl-phosphate reductase